MRYFIICGELSGDLYAYELAKRLKEKNTQIIGIGGPKLKSIANKFLFLSTKDNKIGLGYWIQKWTTYRQLYKKTNHYLKNNKIDKVILIDFQHHNIKLASYIKKYNIPIITFITPNFWIWKDKKQAQKIISFSNIIITIYKKEYLFYKSLTKKPVFYFGHPMIALLKNTPLLSTNKSKSIITLFPGSRRQELSLYLNPMLRATKILHQKYPKKTFYLALSTKYFFKKIEKALKKNNCSFIKINTNNNHHLFEKSECILCASGTSTLNGLFYNTKMVILAALPHITFLVAKYILKIKIPFVTLPNIIANKEIIPELVQYNINTKNIIASIEKQLNNKQSLSQTRAETIENLKKETSKNIFEKVMLQIKKKTY